MRFKYFIISGVIAGLFLWFAPANVFSAAEKKVKLRVPNLPSGG